MKPLKNGHLYYGKKKWRYKEQTMKNKHDREFTNEDREQLLEMLSLAEERLEQSADHHFQDDDERKLYTYLDLDISRCVVEVIKEAIITNKLPDFDIRYYED